MDRTTYHREWRRRNLETCRLRGMQAYRRKRERDLEGLNTNARRVERIARRWCIDVLGITQAKTKEIRLELRSIAQRTGQDFIELAIRHNVLLRTERRALGIDDYEDMNTQEWRTWKK